METRTPVYKQVSYTGIDGLDDIGSTYIEVDMTDQMMYYYVNGRQELSTPVVTGNTSLGRGTPQKVCYIYFKQRNRVLRGEEEMHLTRKEYDLLLLFLRNRGRALYRDYLYETVWGDDGTGCDTRTLDTHIARLRRKLNLGDRLRSVRQIGYMLEKE